MHYCLSCAYFHGVSANCFRVGEEFFVKIVRNIDSEIVSWEDAQRRVFKIIAGEGYASGDSDGEPDTEVTQHHPQIAHSV